MTLRNSLTWVCCLLACGAGQATRAMQLPDPPRLPDHEGLALAGRNLNGGSRTPVMPATQARTSTVSCQDELVWKQALMRFLAGAGVTGSVEILACAASQPLPSELEMDAAKLQHLGGDRYLWRSQLVDGIGASVVAWVRFQGKFSRRVCVAARDLNARSMLSAGDCEMQQRPAVLTHHNPAVGGSVAGMELRRTMRKGGEIRPTDVNLPMLVRQGQSIRVLVVGSAAEIGFEAISKQNGRSGDAVLVENPVSKRVFRAIVNAPGLALVRISRTEGAQ